MWTCSHCGLPIQDSEQGILIADDNLTNWRIVHHISCDTRRGPWHSLSYFVGKRGARWFQSMRKQGAFRRLTPQQIDALEQAVVRPDYNPGHVQRTTFRKWIRAQVKRDDPVGDLARDMVQDRNQMTHNPSLNDLYSYISVIAPEQVLVTLVSAYREWQSYGNTYRQSVKPPFKAPTGYTEGWLTIRFLVLKRDHYRCQICGRTAQDGVKLEVDHKIARSKGGSDDLSNLWTLCFDCNRGKRDKSL